jgi:hypothetical protein
MTEDYNMPTPSNVEINDSSTNEEMNDSSTDDEMNESSTNDEVNDSSTNDDFNNDESMDDEESDLKRIKNEMSNNFELVLLEGFKCNDCMFLTTEEYIMNKHKIEKTCLLNDYIEATDSNNEEELSSTQDEETSKEMLENQESQIREQVENDMKNIFQSFDVDQKNNNSLNSADFEASSTNAYNKEKKEVRLYKCTVCENKFRTIYNLDFHIRDIHNKEKNIFCKICNEGFFRRTHLTRHTCAGSKQSVGDIQTDTNQELACENGAQIDLNSEKEDQIGPNFEHGGQSEPNSENEGQVEKNSVNESENGFIQLDLLPQLESSYTKTHVSKSKSDIEVQRFSCNLCEKKFSQKWYVKVHIKEVHTKERNHHCTVCSLSFFKRSYLKKHSFVCQKKSDDDKTTLKSEKQIESIKNLYPITPDLSTTTVNPKADSSTSTKNLKADFEERNFSCTICDKKFFSKKYVGVHIREVHVQERKHICLRCNRGFFKKAYLKKHSCGSTRKSDVDKTLKKLELDSEKEVEINDSTQLVLVSNQKLSDPAPITKLTTPESRMQTPESRIQTPESLKEKHENPDKNFTSSLHSRENHRDEINFLCFKCKRGFLKISHLEKHFKTCRLETKMSVKTLTKKQSQNASDTTLKLRSKNPFNIELKKIVKDQTRVYECQSCNKTFGNKKKLNRHKKEVHIGEVKYGCSSCDKKFARMEHLKRHLKSNNLMCLSPSEEVINYILTYDHILCYIFNDLKQ